MFNRFGKPLCYFACSSAAALKVGGSCQSESNSTSNVKKNRYDGMALMPGSTCKHLANDIAKLLDCPTIRVTTKRFSDGETLVLLNDTVRGKHVFVVQTCAAPISDNIIELLQMISAARNSGADRVTAVIPYFGYKFHRRGLPLYASSQSKFIWSAAFDFAKLLQVVGVDCVISVDLQRPGQGHEACFFDNMIPVESLYSGDIMAQYFIKQLQLDEKRVSKGNKLVVVSATTKCVKKTRRFQQYFAEQLKTSVGFAVYVHREDAIEHLTEDSKAAVHPTEILGDISGCDVVIVDEIVDSAGTLSSLCRQLKKEGANKIYVCASHGLFSGNSMELIDLSPVEFVLVTDSIPLPANASKKIIQVPMAPLLAKIVDSNMIQVDEAAEDNEKFGSLINESEDLVLD